MVSKSIRVLPNVKIILALLWLVGYERIEVHGQEADIKTVEIAVLPGLQFSIARFSVKPRERIKLILNNTDDMDHNFLIVRPGSRERVVSAANNLGAAGPEANFIPNTADVLWAIPVTAPHEAKSIVFNAPEQEGIYPYVCTYPGHGAIMFGAMYVSQSGKMPELKTDTTIPNIRRGEDSGPHYVHLGSDHETVPPLHAYNPTPPYHYRVFIDGASPAAIAVALPDDISFCWDAGTSHLRFAWTDGFLDNSDLWKGKGNAEAKVVGELFYRSKVGFPIRIGDKEPVHVAYRGYRMKERYLEFHYQIDGVDVYELIRPKAGGGGLERVFRIPNAKTDVMFLTSEDEEVTYTASAGEWQENILRLTAEQARLFTLSMSKGGE